MKIEDLQDAIGQLDDHVITETARARRKKRPTLRFRVGAIAAAVAIIVTSFIVIQVIRRPGNSPASGVVALAMPEYPIMHKCPSEDMLSGSASDQEAFDKANDAWYADLLKQRNQPEDYKDGVMALAREANRLLLKGNGENRIYSPINVYMALSLLAETSGGDTRTELLQVLGVDTIEELRKKAESLWNAHYLDDGQTTSLLANSIWLDESLAVKKMPCRFCKTHTKQPHSKAICGVPL